MISIARSLRHHGATGKTLLPTLMVGTRTDLGPVDQVRTKKKYPRRYRIRGQWMRRDEFTVTGNAHE